jgi:hypothetical protein
VTQLEAVNPTSAPVEAPDLLDGNWILMWVLAIRKAIIISCVLASWSIDDLGVISCVATCYC